MSEVEISTCEFIKEVESAAREARNKAASDWSSPLSMAYYHCSLELRRIVSRHVSKDECACCRRDESRRQASERTSMLAYHDHSRQASTMGVTQ
jgi:hypothetical protein